MSLDEHSHGSRSRPRVGSVAALSFGHFLHDVYSSFLAPVLPLLMENLGISYSLSGLLYLFQRLPSLANPFIGMVADKTNVRYFVVAAPALTAAVMSFLPAAPSYAALCGLLFVMGISSACFHVPAPVMVKRAAGSRTGTGMSFYMLGGELARSAGPLVILGAISLWGTGGTWRLAPLGLIAAVVLYTNTRGLIIHRTAKNGENRPEILTSLWSMKSLFLPLIGFLIFKAFTAASLTAFLPVYMKTKGASLWIAGACLSILELAGAAGTLLSGTLSDRVGRKNMLLFASVAMPSMMWLFILSVGWAVVPVLLLLGFVTFSTTPVVLAFIQDHAGEYPSSANGVFMTISFAITSLTITALGIIIDQIGLETTYRICATLSFGSIFFAALLPNHHAAKRKEL